MHLGDLVKFVEKHKSGLTREIIGLVIEKRDPGAPGREKPIYRIRWFANDTTDSWHISPAEDANIRDLYIISSARGRRGG
tara:strand:- start:214 stop:453 length:240 start_codon:yes stop_codon:yes gene_type:complete